MMIAALIRFAFALVIAVVLASCIYSVLTHVAEAVGSAVSLNTPNIVSPSLTRPRG